MDTTIAPLTIDQERALELLSESRRVLLTGHERPDGDCVGAQIALARVLHRLGKETAVLNPDPPEAQYDFLMAAAPFSAYDGGELPEHDLLIMLDGSDLSRTAGLEPSLRASPARKLVVDHHIHVGDAWWDGAFTDVRASATGLLVYRIAQALSVELDEFAALGVFTSIVTDTGWFKYSNTDAETLSVAARLVEAGVRPHELYQRIFQRRSGEYPLQVGKALQTVEYHAGGRLALVRVPLDEKGRPVRFETDDVLDLLRSVGSVEVVLLLRSVGPTRVKLSARSKTSYDVDRLARRFGGGGHAKASGASLEGSLDVLASTLVSAALEGFSAPGESAR